MDLVEAVRTRRSVARLTDPGPSDDEICDMITDAARGPDHGLVRPWRLVLVRGDARNTLGAAFAGQLSTGDPKERSRASVKPLRAPVLVSIVFTPRGISNVPHWEQLAATACVVNNLMLLLHAQGWGAMWRTGAPCTFETVRDLLGIEHDEQLLGWIYIGTPASETRPSPPACNWRERVSILSNDGIVTRLANLEARSEPCSVAFVDPAQSSEQHHPAGDSKVVHAGIPQEYARYSPSYFRQAGCCHRVEVP